MRAAVMASGRGSNFDALSQAARQPESTFRIALLVCDQPEAPVLDKAHAQGIPVALLDIGSRRGPWSDPAIRTLLDTLREYQVEALCLAGFMRILPSEIVTAYAGRVLNIHPSLLPSFPGLRPQRQALRAGVKVSGCTVHFVDEGVDTGPIVMQSAVPVLDGDTEETLSARILEEEHRLYPNAIHALAEGRIRIDGRHVSLQAPTVTGR